MNIIKKVLLILIVSQIYLLARDNPFSPTLNLDVTTNNTVDEIPYFQKTTTTLPSTARILKKIKIEYQNIDGSVNSKEIVVDKKIDWHNQIEIIQRGNEEKGSGLFGYYFKKLKLSNTDKIKIKYAKQAIYILTNDEKIRDLMVVSPYRIVIDFDGRSTFASKRVDIKNSFFTRCTIGNHDAYYRLVLEIDSYYDYKITKKDDGYLVEIKH